jgi:hypothetical protein
MNENKRLLVLILSLVSIPFIVLILVSYGTGLRPNVPTPSPTPSTLFTETTTETPTFSPTSTATDTPFPTATILIFTAKVFRPSYCYNGPSESYLYTTIVPANTIVDILGMDSDSNDWFMIQDGIVTRCWIRKTFLDYKTDLKQILVLTTAFTIENSSCRIYPREGGKAQTTIPSGWRIVINAKSNPNAEWVLVTPHDSTDQCWLAKRTLTVFAEEALPSVGSDVLVNSPTPIPSTKTHRPDGGNLNRTPTSIPPTSGPHTSIPPTSIPPTSGPHTSIPPTSIPPTSIPPTSIPPTSIPPTSIPPTSIPPTSIPPTATLCWPPGHCK